MSISRYSTTPSENTDPTHGAREGMQAGDVNDVVRQDKANQRDQWNDAEWFEFKDGTHTGSASYVSGTQFSISGEDATAHYHVGRKVKVTDSGGGNVKYGAITNVSAHTSGSFTVTISGDTLTNEPIKVYTGIISAVNSSIPAEPIQDVVGGMVSGNTETGLSVTYNDVDGTMDLVLDVQHDESFTTALKGKLDGIEASANNYSHPTDAGNKHIPAGGAASQLLRYSASGTATWWTPDFAAGNHNHDSTYKSNFTVHTGTAEPAAGLGANGDWYIRHD